MKDTLTDDHAMIVCDFSPYNATALQLTQEESRQSGMQVLHIVVIRRSTKDVSTTSTAGGNPLKFYYIDFVLEEDSNNNYVFFKTAMSDSNVKNWLTGAKRVSVWSDGASKHFKQGRTITFICRHWLENAIVDYNFFASYHGKGPCDGHARMLRVKAQRGDAMKTRAELVVHLNSLRDTTAELLAADVDNGADTDWVTDIDSLRSYHHFLKSSKRENVMAMERMTNDPNGDWTHRLVLKRSELPPALEGAQRCSNCHEAGHQISTCARIFSMSVVEEQRAVVQAHSRGLADPSDDDDDDNRNQPNLANARRKGRQQRKQVDADSKKSARLDNRARKVAEDAANRCRNCDDKWRRNARMTWYQCDYCDEYSVCAKCGQKGRELLRQHESNCSDVMFSDHNLNQAPDQQIDIEDDD